MSVADKKTKEHLLPAYQKMMTRVDKTQKQSTTKNLQQHIQGAIERAVELNELTHEEADRADWMRFDLELIEERLLSMFSMMVDHTRQELENLAERAHQAIDWNSGEITALGTLYCEQCTHPVHFHQPDYIPVCQNCGATRFKRMIEAEK